MNKHCYIVHEPIYEFDNLTKDQFIRVRNFMVEFEGLGAVDESMDIRKHLTGYGSNHYKSDIWWYRLHLNTAGYGKYCTTDRNLSDGYIRLRQILKVMDEVAEQIEKIISEGA